MYKLKSTIKIISILILAGASFFAFLQSGNKIKIFLVGDSTMADKPLADNPERGWGQMLPSFFDANVVVENHARNGRSSKSFIDEGRWKTVFDNLHKGDYVFIQFAHNDEKKYDSLRYTEPHTSFKNNLIKFVDEAREKGAVPILITPVNRRKFDTNDSLVDTHGEYTDVVRETAEEKNVPLIDLYKMSKSLFNSLGSEGTKNIFEYNLKKETTGKIDNTHFNQIGAAEIAGLVVKGIKILGLPLKDYLINGDSILSIGKGKTVGLDYYFNNEWKEKKGKKYRYHYVWEDKENSGYYELGKIFTRYNAKVSELKTAPAAEDLNKLSIYIIVDPDTKKENPDPNFIDSASIENIVDWVKAGGVLAIFANDKGNSEFEHLNNLSGKFGIHFNVDSRNDVTGKNFDMGKFINLPDHPIFQNVDKIYLKEISTLKLEKPAEPILTDNGEIIMASAKIGKGFVFAVGDPWLYNEYIDNRKLPEGFENKKAAENLSAWLLAKANKTKESKK